VKSSRCKVLAVTRRSVDSFLDDEVTEMRNNGSKNPVLFLHIGVARMRSVINIETFGVNAMHFPNGDGEGLDCMRNTPIDPTKPLGAPEQIHFVTSDLRNAVRKLNTQTGGDERSRFTTKLSADAGQYVCNYTLFQSNRICDGLRKTLGRDCRSVFVHIPPFAAESDPADIEAGVRAILAELTTLMLPQPAPVLSGLAPFWPPTLLIAVFGAVVSVDRLLASRGSAT